MKKNVKKVIWLVIGLIVGTSTIVGAATIFRSEDITYSSPTNKTNVKDSLDELYSKVGKCPEGWHCYTDAISISDKVKLGDYISMTPTRTSYTISKDVTGYDSDQTVNPSELNLWIVMRKRDDGCIDLVSHYATKDQVIFKGKTGYTNFANVLNRFSNDAFVDSDLVSVGWSIGTHGEEQVCKDYRNCYEGNTNINDVVTLWGITNEVRAFYPGTMSTAPYYLPSRVKDIDKGLYLLSFVKGGADPYGLAGVYNDNKEESQAGSSIRPMVRIVASARISGGAGTFENPYILS